MWYGFSGRYIKLPEIGRIVCLLLAVAALGTVVEAAPVTIISPSGPLPNIVAATGQTNLDAAEDLADYLSRLSGRTILVVSSPASTGAIIRVGNDSFVQSNAPEVAGLFSDGFIMKLVNSGGRDNLILAGNLDRASQWAVERFLKDTCGVRWLFPDPVYGEVVPSMPTITVDSLLDETVEPDYTSRGTFGMDYFTPGGVLRRGGPYPSLHGKHSIAIIFNNGSYSGEIFDLHPEWFPYFYNTDTRFGGTVGWGRHWWPISSGWQICTANPETVTHAVQYCLDFFAANPDVDTVSVGQNDNSGICEDQLSLDLKNSVSPPYTNSEMWWLWVNQVAAQVKLTYPDKWVEALAYLWSRSPPRFALESNVAITYTIFGDGDMQQCESWGSPPANCQSVNLYSWAFGGHMMGFRHYPSALRDYLQWGRDMLGARAHFAECGVADWTIDGPKYYCAQTFQWNADADPGAVMTDFCDASYGSASTEMKAFWDRFEGVWENRGTMIAGTDAARRRYFFYLWTGWNILPTLQPNIEFRDYAQSDVDFLDTRMANALTLAAGDDAGVQYRMARMEEAWNYYRTFLLSRFNYYDNPRPDTTVNSEPTKQTVRTLAEGLAGLRAARRDNKYRMKSHPLVNPRMVNWGGRWGWLEAFTIFSNERSLLGEACTAISDYIVSASDTATAIAYWEAIGTTDELYESAQTQIYMLNTPVLADLLLLSNGDFETGGLTGWTSSGTTSITSSDAHAGTSCARLFSGTSSISQTVTVSPLDRYRLTVWGKYVQTPSASYVPIEANVIFYSGSETLVDLEPQRIMFESVSAADGWTRLRSMVSTPVAADSAKIIIMKMVPVEVRIDDVKLERVLPGPVIEHGVINDNFDGQSLDTSKWFQATGGWVIGSGGPGIDPPRLENGHLVYDSDKMYGINSYASFDNLLNDRYRLRIHLSTLAGATDGSTAFGIKTGVNLLNIHDSGVMFYHYFDFYGTGNIHLQCYNYQDNTLTAVTGGNLPLSCPVTDVWYTFYFDPNDVTVYASVTGYAENPENELCRYAHGIGDIAMNGPVYLKFERGTTYKLDDVSLQRRPICGDPDFEYLAFDLSGDCYVTSEDLSYIAAKWLQCNEPADPECDDPDPPVSFECGELWGIGNGFPEDLNKDCYVNLGDIALLSNNWFSCNDPCNTEDCEPLPGPSEPFFEDFESYSVGADVTSPWQSLFGNIYCQPAYGPGRVEVDTGANGTQVLDMVDAAYWGNPITLLPVANQYSQGSVEWEMASQQDGAYGTARTWFNTDGGTGVGVHDWIVNLSFHSGGDIWERPPGQNFNDMTSPPNVVSGVITATQWHKYRVDFDFLGGDGSNGEWSLFMDDSPTATLQGALGTDYLAFTRTLKVIGWELPSGQGFSIDNVSVTQNTSTN